MLCWQLSPPASFRCNALIPIKRHQFILNAIMEEEYISLIALADLLDVSVMTIRRDVAELSSQGALVAVRGGVKPLIAPSFRMASLPENDRLVRAALSQVKESQTLFLEGGSLCRQLAQLIPWRAGMTLVTNDFYLAEDVMRQTSAQIFLIGGELDRSNNTFHNQIALEMLKSLSFELLFLAPTSWSERGIRHHDEHRQVWYRTLLAVSRRSVMLADRRYYDKSGLFTLYPLSAPDIVLTNHPSASRILEGKIDPQKLYSLH